MTGNEEERQFSGLLLGQSTNTHCCTWTCIFNCKTMIYVWVGKCAAAQEQCSLHACPRYTMGSSLQSWCSGTASMYPIPIYCPHVHSAVLRRWSMGMSYLKHGNSWQKGLWSYINSPREKNVLCFNMQSGEVMIFPVLLCQSYAYIPSEETRCCKYHGFGSHYCCHTSR